MHAQIVAASSQPLPSPQQWEAKHGAVAWERVKDWRMWTLNADYWRPYEKRWFRDPHNLTPASAVRQGGVFQKKTITRGAPKPLAALQSRLAPHFEQFAIRAFPVESFFRIQQFEAEIQRREDSQWKPQGVVGIDSLNPGSPTASQEVVIYDGDRAAVRATFNQAAFYYLASIGPYGLLQLHRVGEKSVDRIGDSQDVKVPLAAGAGMQALVLIASQEELPEYENWRDGLPEFRWEPTRNGSERRLYRGGLEWTSEEETSSPSEAKWLQPLYNAFYSDPRVDDAALLYFPVKPALKLKDFALRYSQNVPQNSPSKTLGKDGRSVQVGDLLRLTGRWNRPAYCYILVLNRNGQDHLLYPSRAGATPAQTEQNWQWPPAAAPGWKPTSPGEYALVVLASSRPLPSYNQWVKEADQPPWKASPGGQYRRCDNGVWLEASAEGMRVSSQTPQRLTELYEHYSRWLDPEVAYMHVFRVEERPAK